MSRKYLLRKRHVCSMGGGRCGKRKHELAPAYTVNSVLGSEHLSSVLSVRALPMSLSFIDSFFIHIFVAISKYV